MLLHQLEFITPTKLQDAFKILKWATKRISEPHPDLGRNGPICPFVFPSIKNDQLFIRLHYEIDGSEKELLETIIYRYQEVFLDYLSSNDYKGDVYNAIVVAFPNIIGRNNIAIFEQVAMEMKSAFVQSGLMLGDFHPESTVNGIRNPDFRPMISPLPLIVIRQMAVHDILFLHKSKILFVEYDLHFGEKYKSGQLGNRQGYVNMYKVAQQRYKDYV